MSKNLDYFELQYDESVILHAERLFEQNEVVQFEQSENNLFSGNVKEGNTTYEVEVFKPKAKSRIFTCTCDEFQKYQYCRHSIALLYGIRAFYRDRRAAKKNHIKKTSLKSLTINTLLEVVSENDIKDYIRRVARRDKKFSTLIKAHFASKIDLPDINRKYEGILKSVVKPVKDTGKYLSASEVRHFILVTDELIDQLEDSMVIRDYVEALAIWKATIIKTAYVLHNANYQLKELENIHLRLWKILKNMVNADISPDLGREIVAASMEVASLSYYAFSQVIYNILELVLFTEWVDNVDETVKWLKSMVASRTKEEQNVLIALWLRLAYQHHLSINMDALFNDYELQLNEVFFNILKVDQAACVVHYTNQIKKWRPQYKGLDKVLLKAYAQLGQREELCKLALDSFMQNRDMASFKVLKNNTPPNEWPVVKQEILSMIEKVTIRTQILVREGDWNTLINELSATSDISLLMKYDQRLNVHVPKELANLYVQLVRDYLATHIGKKAGTHLREILLHLEKIGAVTSIKKIHKLLDKEFPHRTSSTSV